MKGFFLQPSSLLLELQLGLDSSSKDVVVVLPTPPLLCLACSSFVLSKILSFVWLFGATKVCISLEELSKNLGCAFAIFPFLSLAWTRATTLVTWTTTSKTRARIWVFLIWSILRIMYKVVNVRRLRGTFQASQKWMIIIIPWRSSLRSENKNTWKHWIIMFFSFLLYSIFVI